VSRVPRFRDPTAEQALRNVMRARRRATRITTSETRTPPAGSGASTPGRGRSEHPTAKKEF
jgi:hypothetical protein